MQRSERDKLLADAYYYDEQADQFQSKADEYRMKANLARAQAEAVKDEPAKG